MDSYTSFAYVYDTFMDQEPYDLWADRVCGLLKEYGLPLEKEAQGQETAALENNASLTEDIQAESSRTETSRTETSRSETSRTETHWTETSRTETSRTDVSRSETSRMEEMGAVRNRECPQDPGEDTYVCDERRIVVDLGCGTGKFTEILASRGYDMIGIDLSEDMLAIAQERRLASGSDILYTRQDMRGFELYGAAGAMVSVGDSVNYLLEETDLESMFRCVARALLPGGVFVFDFKTVHLYRDVIGDRTIAEDRADCAFIWDNYYDPETCINEYDLAIYVALDEDPEMPDCLRGDPLFRRFDEIHCQRGYEPEQIRRIAESAGLIWITARDAETGADVTACTERVVAVVRRPRT